MNAIILKETWIDKKVNYSFLRTFGCEAFVHIDKDDRTKLEAKSKKCTFIGYGVDDFGYHLWDFENHKSIRSRDVVFNEIGHVQISVAGKERGKGKHIVHSA